MSNDIHVTDSQQLLEKLARRGSEQAGKFSVVTSPGARAAAWPIKVKSLSSYNVYNVCVVELGAAGSEPVEIGQQMQAINMAESFTQGGQLSAGTYAVMFRIGEKRIFYVQV